MECKNTDYTNIHMLGPIKDKLGLKVTGFSVSPMNSAKSVFDRLADPTKPDAKNTLGTYVWASQRSLPWQSTDSIQDITSISRAYPSWIKLQDIWTV
jgi:hypothetical protein